MGTFSATTSIMAPALLPFFLNSSSHISHFLAAFGSPQKNGFALLGPYGMVGGQQADMDLNKKSSLSLDEIEWIQNHKTGALISSCSSISFEIKGIFSHISLIFFILTPFLLNT